VTVTREAPSKTSNDEAEALFPEARRRRRRIRLIVSVSILAVAGAIGGAVYAVNNSGGSPTAAPAIPIASGPHQIAAASVTRDNLTIHSAHESWRTITSYPGCSPPVTGIGVLDLVHQRASVTVSSPGCRSGDGGYTQRGSYRTVQIGTSVYRTRQPQEYWDYGAGKSWLVTPQYTQAALASATPLSVLKSVSGPFMFVGTSDIRGVSTRQYVGSASLASLLAETGATGSGPIGTPDPPLKQIPITVNIWIDAQHRVRQISTWEPYYTQNDIGGASEGGPYIVQGSTPTPDGPPRQQGFVQTTLDLWGFGATVHITPPPAASVATPG
jgi:hypothetical protein